jgi:hypothetical protein
MKNGFFWVLACMLGLILASSVHPQGAPAPHGSEILTYGGRFFKNPSSPEYASYDQTMSMEVAKRIKQKYRVNLDYTSYSAFELLEIEALLKCKKSDETVNSLLERFQS